MARRRTVQLRYNEENHITPESIKKSISQVLTSVYEADYMTVPVISEKRIAYGSEEELPAMIRRLKDEMKEAARHLEFEKAAEIRDQIKSLTEILVTLGGEALASPAVPGGRSKERSDRRR